MAQKRFKTMVGLHNSCGEVAQWFCRGYAGVTRREGGVTQGLRRG